MTSCSEPGGRWTDRMATQCRSSKCTAERKGFRRELDSWRHKLIHCVGKSKAPPVLRKASFDRVLLRVDVPLSGTSFAKSRARLLFCPCLARAPFPQPLLAQGVAKRDRVKFNNNISRAVLRCDRGSFLENSRNVRACRLHFLCPDFLIPR